MSENINRCEWCGTDPLYQKYHDEEWGVPVHDDQVHFEFIILEGAQAGLSWITILKKRENYRKAFDNFNPSIIEKYDEQKIQHLIQNPGIIRNKLKIRSAVSNAKHFLSLQKEFGSFDTYFWQFVDNKPIVHNFGTLSELPASTAISIKIARDLKKRGFKFMGPAIVYAHMQACGLVNDHTTDCFRYKEINQLY